MGSEFLMPLKYEGSKCGLTVAIFGIDKDVDYSDMIIYIEGMEQEACSVSIDDSNNFKTTSATFGGLQENRFYNVVAELNRDNKTATLQTKVSSSVASPIMLMSLDNTPQQYSYGGLVRTPSSHTRRAIGGGV